MNFVMTSQRMPIGRKPIHCWPLRTLLFRFGIEPERHPGDGWATMFGKRAKRNLWDLWEAVRKHWQKLRRELHPDVSHKHHSQFATMSHMYDTIMLRFKAKGIG